MRDLRLLCRLGVLALALLPGCTTGVLVADPDRGFEGAGDRYLRLRLETVQLDVVEVPSGEFELPGALCLQDPPPGAPAPCRALRFKLPFQAWNGTDQSWPVRLGMFRLDRLRGGDASARPVGEPLRAPDVDTTVALLAPHSGAHFDVLVHIAGLRPDEDPLRGEYRLTVQAGPGETLLVKDLSVGSFSQLSQIVRFLGTATLLLVAAAAL